MILGYLGLQSEGHLKGNHNSLMVNRLTKLAQNPRSAPTRKFFQKVFKRILNCND